MTTHDGSRCNCLACQLVREKPKATPAPALQLWQEINNSIERAIARSVAAVRDEAARDRQRLDGITKQVELMRGTSPELASLLDAHAGMRTRIEALEAAARRGVERGRRVDQLDLDVAVLGLRATRMEDLWNARGRVRAAKDKQRKPKAKGKRK